MFCTITTMHARCFICLKYGDKSTFLKHQKNKGYCFCSWECWFIGLKHKQHTTQLQCTYCIHKLVTKHPYKWTNDLSQPETIFCTNVCYEAHQNSLVNPDRVYGGFTPIEMMTRNMILFNNQETFMITTTTTT